MGTFLTDEQLTVCTINLDDLTEDALDDILNFNLGNYMLP